MYIPHVYLCVLTDVHIYKCIHTHIHARTHVRTHTHTLTCILTHVHAHTHSTHDHRVRNLPFSGPVSMDTLKWSEYYWTVELTYIQWMRYSGTLIIYKTTSIFTSEICASSSIKTTGSFAQIEVLWFISIVHDQYFEVCLSGVKPDTILKYI